MIQDSASQIFFLAVLIISLYNKCLTYIYPQRSMHFLSAQIHDCIKFNWYRVDSARNFRVEM